MRARVLFVAFVMTCALSASTLADLTPEQTKRAEALIAQLADGAFATRRKAVEELVAMGPQVVPLVRKALAGTDDPEVKLRCEEVIKALPDPDYLIEKRVKRLGPKLLVYDDWPVLSPAGGRLLGEVRRDDRRFLVLDGQEIVSPGSTSGPVFSPDGRRLAYRFRSRDGWFVVCDGKLSAPMPKLPIAIVFSPDSKRLACYVRHGGAWVGGRLKGATHFVLVDGVRGPEYEQGWFPVFSPDSKHVAYPAGRDDKEFVVVDGEEGPPYDRVVHVGYSPDGRLTYSARRGKEWFKILDGKKVSPPYHRMGRATFSPDGKRTAYEAGDFPKPVFLICDDRKVGPYSSVGAARFSRDGRRVAYHAWRDRRSFAVCDGMEGPAYDEVNWQLVFSGDGRHLAYPARRGKLWQIVCDGREGPGYIDTIRHGFRAVFSPNGRHLAYKARRDGKEFIVLDGMESPSHDWVRLPEAHDKVEGKLRYAVMDDDGAWLIEVDWPRDRDWTNGFKPVAR